jgi:hypothetical protein
VAFSAAQELPRHGDHRGFKALIRIVVADDNWAEDGIETLMRSARPQHFTDAKCLLRQKSAARRRLGARLLAVCNAPGAAAVGFGAPGDGDPTVRCASAWLIARRDRADELLPRVDQFLTDVEEIDGPPLDDPRKMHWAERARPVQCCADVVYRWFADRPAMLSAAARGQQRNEKCR